MHRTIRALGAAAALLAPMTGAAADAGATRTGGATGAEAPVRTVDERTRFQIGSVTKTFTATLLAQMVLDHEVSLDDPIQDDLPAGVTAPSYRGTPITLGSIAEQRSGLPRLPPNLVPRDASNPYLGYTAADLYDALRHQTLTRAPGSQYEYSNFGYLLLGQLLANRAHATYAKLVETRILQPLHMDDTVVPATPAGHAALVPGYASDGSPQPAWDFGELGGVGAVESDLHDMVIFANANLAAPAGPLGPAMALAQQPRAATDANSPLRIGLAWMTNPNTGITIHNGQTGGYHAVVTFDRTRRRAVVVLANVADEAVDLLALHLLVPNLVPAPAYPPAQSEASPYAGVYRFSPAFAITVFKRGGTLYAQATGQSALVLAPLSGRTFAVQGVDAQITFDADAHGVATGLTLHQNGLDQHANKAP